VLPGRANDIGRLNWPSGFWVSPKTVEAAELPIARAGRGRMPEVLEDGDVYFDSESPSSIAAAIEELIDDPGRRAADHARQGTVATILLVALRPRNLFIHRPNRRGRQTKQS